MACPYTRNVVHEGLSLSKASCFENLAIEQLRSFPVRGPKVLQVVLRRKLTTVHVLKRGMPAFVVASCALLLFACGGGNKQSQEPRADRPMATIGESVAMFVEMGKVVMSAADDCDLMATKVGSWLDANGEKRTRINTELSMIKSAKTEEVYRQRLGQHAEVILGMKAGVDSCQQHAGFMRVWDRLDE